MPPRIDLRSDTMTQPTDAMRDAMATADVGNSALGEDPTVDRLETRAADVLGKESALFLSSGTMANLAAMIAWTRAVERPEIVAEATSHVLLYESASIARIAHAVARPIEGEGGLMDLDRVQAHLRGPETLSIKPQTALVCLEQTHNHAGGVPLPLAHMEEVASLAAGAEAPVHIDGARLFNAATALGKDPALIADPGDSVMIALTKGLGAPVGSLLAGPSSFIEDATRAKHLLGGGLRQAGHLAAAGLLALDQGPARLAEDHANAQRLATGLAEIEGIHVEVDAVETNIVFADVSALGVDAATFADAAAQAGVGLDGMMREHHVRAVTHRDVGRGDIDEAVEAVHRVADSLRA